MELREIVAGDMIAAPCWPGTVTVTGLIRANEWGGTPVRVFWTAPEGDGATWLPERALVRRTWDFRSQATVPVFTPGPSVIAGALQAMAAVQREAGIGGPFDDYDAEATMAALLEEF